MHFTADEYQVISNALHIAKARFTENAKDLDDLDDRPGYARLAEQFRRQATDAQRVYDRIANELGIAG